MRRAAAVILVGAGLILAVGVPIAIAVRFDIDPGKNSVVLLGGMMPGLGVMVLARKLWKGDQAAKPSPDPVQPGYRVCGLCGRTLPEAEGVSSRLDPLTPAARVAFVCHACTRYRTRRALAILVLFLTALGALALVVSLTIPGGQK